MNKLKFDFTKYRKGFIEIDTQMLNYIKNHIRPYIERNGKKIFVQAILGSPEKGANSVLLKDANNKVQSPLITITRKGYTPTNIGINNLDANDPHNVIFTKTRYSDNRRFFRNIEDFKRYDQKPEHYTVTTVPEYITIKYTMILFSEFISDANKVEEQFNYHNRAYWNGTNHTFIRNYSNEVFYDNEERTIKTTVDIEVKTKIVPEAISNLIQAGGKLKPYKFKISIYTPDSDGSYRPPNVVNAYYGKNKDGHIPGVTEILEGHKIKTNTYSYNPNTEYDEYSWFAVPNAPYVFNSWKVNENNQGNIEPSGLYTRHTVSNFSDTFNVYIFNYSSELKHTLTFR